MMDPGLWYEIGKRHLQELRLEAEQRRLANEVQRARRRPAVLGSLLSTLGKDLAGVLQSPVVRDSDPGKIQSE